MFRDCVSKLPTSILQGDDSQACPWHKWKHGPGFTYHGDHMVFRDPGLLQVFSRSMDPQVFQ